MKNQSPTVHSRLPVEPQNADAPGNTAVRRRLPIARAFTLVEVLVVMVLLSLIVLALMAVFNSTQTAFRASLTQSDVLEGGRAVMDMMASDLREMSPSFGGNRDSVNFSVAVTNYPSPPSPFLQPLVASSPQQDRTNVLENIFILSRGNDNGVPTWYGVGYAVTANAPAGALFSLYRFETNGPMTEVSPAFIFTNDFEHFLTNVTSGSHLLDGVVHLTMRAYDPNGTWMTNNYLFSNGNTVTNKNVIYFMPEWNEAGFQMYSNTLPATVQIDMGVLEDRTLQHAEIIGPAAQSNYLAQQAGKVHLFRQRVAIPNFDPSAYK